MPKKGRGGGGRGGGGGGDDTSGAGSDDDGEGSRPPTPVDAGLVAVGAGEEGPERLAVLVLVVGAGPLERPDRREVVAEDGGAIDDVLVEDLPMPDRRSLATTDVSLRSSTGTGAGEAAALPPGWEAHEDEQGAVYFYNVHTEEVQWEAPRL